MSEFPIRGHFRYLRFKTFPMTPRTPQCEVFCPLLSSSEHSGVPEDSQPPTFPSLGFTPTLGQSGVATLNYFKIEKCLNFILILDWHVSPTYLTTTKRWRRAWLPHHYLLFECNQRKKQRQTWFVCFIYNKWTQKKTTMNCNATKKTIDDNELC